MSLLKWGFIHYRKLRIEQDFWDEIELRSASTRFKVNYRNDEGHDSSIFGATKKNLSKNSKFLCHEKVVHLHANFEKIIQTRVIKSSDVNWVSPINKRVKSKITGSPLQVVTYNSLWLLAFFNSNVNLLTDQNKNVSAHII